MLLTVARAAAAGGDVAVMVAEPQDREELTSQQVADLLNVSRPNVGKLARQGLLPHRMVGNRHRFNTRDALTYKAREELPRDAETLFGWCLSPDIGPTGRLLASQVFLISYGIAPL